MRSPVQTGSLPRSLMRAYRAREMTRAGPRAPESTAARSARKRVEAEERRPLSRSSGSLWYLSHCKSLGQIQTKKMKMIYDEKIKFKREKGEQRRLEERRGNGPTL